MTAHQVSVIIPTRNRLPTLLRAIDSVLTQQDVELELIVVDDGSTDDTASAVRTLSDSDPRVSLLEQPGVGAARARNVGVAEARFPLIAFNDSDDTWLPGKLSKQCAFLDDHGLDLVAGRCRFIRADATTTIYPEWSASDGTQVTRSQLLQRNCVPTQTMLVRRSLLDEIGGFDERLFRFQDWDLALRASFATDIGMFPEIVAEVSGSGMRISDDHAAAVAASQIMAESLIGLGCKPADVAPIFRVAGWNAKTGGNDRLAVEAYGLALRHHWTLGVAVRQLTCRARSLWRRRL